jgi:3-methyladenine DNA glycosylase AlkD
MTKTEVMKELKANGSEQTRKVYRRHGIGGPLFGVSYAVLGKLRKKIKTDQKLAEQLWATGNHDARTLATMIAEPSEIRAGTLDAWVKDVDNRGMAAAVSNVAGAAPSARSRMEKWTRSRSEMTACAGWHVLATISREHDDLPDAYFKQYIDTIESKIHGSPNWVKHAMNNALINIGVRNPSLQKKALAAAKRIGKIDVDHGETSCKTPDAAAYIKKTVAHRKKKAAKARKAG